MKQKNKFFLIFQPILWLFIFINALLIVFKISMSKAGFDVDFVLIANVILFILSALGFYIQHQQLKSPNPNAFVRGIYGSTLLKLMVIMAALLIFIVASGGTVNKKAIFLSMAIYVLYTTIEVVLLMKMVRTKK